MLIGMPGVLCPQSFTSDLQKFTKGHGKMKCYGLGLGLNTFKMVALTEHFRKLELPQLLNAYTRCAKVSALPSPRLPQAETLPPAQWLHQAPLWGCNQAVT